mmetsp:Transcript_7158/g.10906  ORF Transcript_7158/g.10906 Transcript_7158/m.10906 type:complete len:862 (+) Transcript_7158:124-2709(+)|eukprot:CAMPEP_0167749690 /NCGR_PEP_ID=MMETSP0110_2-20121227/5559_1 /TAXON_ID=629695 /ORGANISM="Gymnochlora sp., Strain CCMP2014" /LENGTH=861 /DNA_ID=CAMNT_0007634895 /DNA_START=723 /DNA_END=3311 /DNA_ORIENTATION=-
MSDYGALSSEQKGILADFSKKGFDDRKYLETAMSTGKAPEMIENITAIIQSISRRVHQHVGSHHQHLLKQADYIKNVSKKLKSTNTRVKGIVESFEKARESVIAPKNKLATKVKQLEFVQKASHLAVQALRVVHKASQLQKQIKIAESKRTARESVKCARLIRDIKQVFDETDLRGIDIVDNHINFIEEKSEVVLALSTERFQSGITNLNQPEIASSLQAFFLLNKLGEKVGEALTSIAAKGIKYIKDGLDVSKLAEQKRAKGSSAAGMWRSALWKHLDVALHHIFESGIQVWNLQQVLVKKRDPATSKSYLAVYLNHLAKEEKESTLAQRFWTLLLEGVRDQLTKAFKSQSFIKTVLVSDYPQLYHLFKTLFKRLSQATNTSFSTQLGRRKKIEFPSDVNIKELMKRASGTEEKKKAIDEKEEEKIAETNIIRETSEDLLQIWESDTLARTQPEKDIQMVLGIYELSFLKVTISKLTDPIKSIFSAMGKGINPSEADGNALMTNIDNTLRSVRLSGSELQIQIANRVLQAMHLLISQAEQQADLSSNLPKSSSIKNASIFKLLSTADKCLSQWTKSPENSLTQSWPPKAIKLLKKAQAQASNLRGDLLEALTSHLKSTASKLMQEIHQESFQRPHQTKTTSKYMRQVQRFCESVARETVPSYRISRPSTVVDLEVQGVSWRIAQIVAEHFLLNSTLISGLREDAKLAIASDVAQLEASLHLLAPKHHFAQPPRWYKDLRTFRQMLFLDDNSLSSKGIIHILPPVIAVQFLLSRMSNRTVPITCVPFKALGTNLSKYIRYVDHHTEAKVLSKFANLIKDIRGKLGKGRKLSQQSLKQANAALDFASSIVKVGSSNAAQSVS